MQVMICYALTVIIWGLTWTAIHIQVGVAPVALSVFYRFVIAAASALIILRALNRLPSMNLKQHGWLVLQGLMLFSVNFLLIYHAAEHMTSGLLAVLFSMTSLFNAFNGWLWFRQRPTPRVYPAALLGILGVALLFWQDLVKGDATWSSILFALAGTFWFSTGNLVTVRVRAANIPLLAGNSWAMFYGALVLGAWCLIQGVHWQLPASSDFWWATLFLAIPGSIIAFATYLTVIKTLGADKAGYATVLFPIVALSVSTWLEGFVWTTPAVAGAILAIVGNLVLFWPVRRRGAPETTATQNAPADGRAH